MGLGWGKCPIIGETDRHDLLDERIEMEWEGKV